MGRTFSILSLLGTLALLGAGCEPAQALRIDLDGDGQPDPLPENRGGPWLGCDEALAGAAAGDVCDFTGGCGRREPTDVMMDTVICLDHRVVRGRQEMWGTFSESCDRTLEVAASCIEWPDQNCQMSGIGSRFTVCIGYGENPPDDGVPGAPWPLTDESSCELLRAGRAENGDPCEGSFVCEGEWPTRDGGFWHTIAWCDGGSLRIVSPFGH